MIILEKDPLQACFKQFCLFRSSIRRIMATAYEAQILNNTWAAHDRVLREALTQHDRLFGFMEAYNAFENAMPFKGFFAFDQNREEMYTISREIQAYIRWSTELFITK